MSATFWNIRRRRAAEIARQQQAARDAEAPYKVEPAEAEKKPAKKVKKHG